MELNRELVLLIIYSIILQQSVQQHIFDETCTYVLENSNKTDKFTLASQIIHIENRNYDVYINFCQSLVGIDDTCDSNALACITRKRGRKRLLFIPNAATSFSAKVENSSLASTNYILTATNTAKCPNGDDNYVLIVVFDKQFNSNKITSSDECFMEITVPHPDVTIRDCAFAYNGIIMDMKPLQLASEQIIQTNDTQIALAACHLAPSCKSNEISICEIAPDGNVFSVSESQHIVYDERSNVLILRGRKAKNKIISEVTINCNWTATFENPVKKAAKYKYSIDSKYGCVKMPLSCQLQDMEYYVYDLSALNKTTGWRVGNLSGILLINVCGILRPRTTGRNACSDTYSQVCYQNGTEYLSYGALHHGLTFDSDNIRLTYTHGSPCTVGSTTKYLNTIVTFLCARNEYGPIVTGNVNCTMRIEWKTPKACPSSIAEDGSFSYTKIKNQIARVTDLSCRVYDDNGQLYDLRSLMSKTLFKLTSERGFKYYINICRPLQVTKDNYLCKVTGACIEDTNEVNIKKRFTWVGSITEPRFENNKLVIHYNGGFCANSTSGLREVVIHFYCSTTTGTLQLSKETGCRTDFQWDTPLACDKSKKTPRSTDDCIMKSSGNQLFDFTKIQNRKFQVNYSNTSYEFDLCSHSVIFTDNATTPSRTSIGLRQLLYNTTNCQYSLLYALTNDTCTSRSLTSVRVNLLCDEIIYNQDNFGNYSINGCNALISLKTNDVCAKMQNDCTIEENDKKQETVPQQQQQEQEPPVVQPTCKIVQDKHEFMINSINELNMTYRKNNYSINGKCNGFVCRNNHTIATLNICPNIPDIEKQVVELHFLGPICQKDFYKVKLQLTCSKKEKVEVVDEGDCFTHFIIEGNQTCPLFSEQKPLLLDNPQTQGTNATALIIGIIFAIMAIGVIVLILFKYHGASFRCLSRNAVGLTSRQALYSKNGDA